MIQPSKPSKPAMWLRVGLMQLAIVLFGAVAVATLAAWAPRPDSAEVATVGAGASEVQLLKLSVQSSRAKGHRRDLEVTRLRLDRATAIIRYSAKHKIPTVLSARIYDIALTEGIHPALAFQLVKVESRFKPRARSTKGAIGYTQIRLSTARGYEPGITEAKLHQRDVNLRLGFRYLRDLLERFDGDLPLALVAYNRGPTLVDSIVSAGGDPSNGYAEIVSRGLGRKASSPLAKGS